MNTGQSSRRDHGEGDEGAEGRTSAARKESWEAFDDIRRFAGRRAAEVCCRSGPVCTSSGWGIYTQGDGAGALGGGGW